MRRQPIRLAWAVPVLLLTIVLLNSACDYPPPLPFPPHTRLIRMDSLWTLTPDQVAQAHEQLVEDQFADQNDTETDAPWYADWETLLSTALADAVDCRRITYWSRNADGQPIQLTGMLYLPRRWLPPPWPSRVSLVAYPHGTELLRDNVPSNNAGVEWVFGAAGALFAGFAMAMPDLPGMGGADPNAYHPYCHAKSLAYSVVDMIQAVQESFTWELYGQYWWDGQLYILGYSEGGYAAMATVRELQLNAGQYPGLAITASACMAGPYDLTGAMRNLMVNSTEPYGAPYFLPYVVLGYDAVYSGPFDPNQAINPLLLPDCLQWMNGVSTPSSEVNRLIAERLGYPQGQFPAPHELLNPTWVNQQLADNVYQTSQVGQILADNNLWPGWVPSRPMLLRHSPDDDRVPYANTEKAFNEFVKAGAIANLTLSPIGKAGDGIGHVSGAIIGIPSAIIWFRNGCPKN
ncbi:MAG TPA: lipase family protein [Phycisphaerae bacterium]|nr:lipase family protein [Phycisphaerae bacterium]